MMVLLLARLMGQYCFARCRRRRLSSVVVCNARGQSATVGRACGWSGGRHCMAGQYGYVPLGRNSVLNDDYLH